MARLHTGRHKVLTTYRSYHGATAGSITMTGDPRRWASEPGMPGVVKFWGPYTYRSAFHADDDAEECERALAHLADVIMVEGAADHRGDRARDRRRHQRHPRAARRLPAGRPRPVRRARHRDDRRRGDGRLRSLRRVVRRRPLGRHARPDLLRQGRQLRLRAARWRDHQPARSPTRSPTGRTPAASRTPAIPLACASAVAQHQHLQGGGHHRARPPPRRRRRRARRWRRSPNATRRSARCAGSACSGRSSWSATATTREPLVPYNAAGAAAKPMAELAAACKAARPVAVHALQPHARRPADHDQRRRHARRARHHRRGPGRRRRRTRSLKPDLTSGGVAPATLFRCAVDRVPGLPDGWREILDARSAQWRLLDEAERDAPR